MKKVFIIGTAGVPACYGGFETLVDNLLNYSVDDIQYTVFCSEKIYSKKIATYKKARLVYLKLNANGIFSIPYDIIALMKSYSADAIFLLGVSGAIFLPIFKMFFKGKIITNIDGLEWKRVKWNSVIRSFLKLSESLAVKYSDVIIGDNKGITDYVWEEYSRKASLIEYGADQAYFVEKNKFISDYSFVIRDYAITVCRIEPENNISLIIEAFLNIKNPVLLVIVGNWNSTSYGQLLRVKYKDIPSIMLLDPIYDIERINYLRSNAKFYIHGHSAGGTNPSLVEAMHLGLNVLAYDCIYNRETTENRAHYWITVSDLSNRIIECLDGCTNGSEMREIAQSRYMWTTIATKYLEQI